MPQCWEYSEGLQPRTANLCNRGSEEAPKARPADSPRQRPTCARMVRRQPGMAAHPPGGPPRAGRLTSNDTSAAGPCEVRSSSLFSPNAISGRTSNSERPTPNAQVGSAGASVLAPLPACGSRFPPAFGVLSSAFSVRRSFSPVRHLRISLSERTRGAPHSAKLAVRWSSRASLAPGSVQSRPEPSEDGRLHAPTLSPVGCLDTAACLAVGPRAKAGPPPLFRLSRSLPAGYGPQPSPTGARSGSGVSQLL